MICPICIIYLKCCHIGGGCLEHKIVYLALRPLFLEISVTRDRSSSSAAGGMAALAAVASAAAAVAHTSPGGGPGGCGGGWFGGGGAWVEGLGRGLRNGSRTLRANCTTSANPARERRRDPGEEEQEGAKPSLPRSPSLI